MATWALFDFTAEVAVRRCLSSQSFKTFTNHVFMSSEEENVGKRVEWENRQLEENDMTVKTGKLSSNYLAHCHITCFCVRMLSHFSCVQLFSSLWTVAQQAPMSMGILQARILEWVAVPSSRGSSRPRNLTCVSHVSCFGRWVVYH